MEAYPVLMALKPEQQSALREVLQANPIDWKDETDTLRLIAFACVLHPDHPTLTTELRTALLGSFKGHFGDYFAVRLIDQLQLILRVLDVTRP